MRRIDPHKTGLALGGFLGGFHLLWSLMVALGLAQPFLDFMFSIHRLAPVLEVQPFRLGLAVLLIVTTSMLGYVFGRAFAAMWNAVHLDSPQ